MIATHICQFNSSNINAFSYIRTHIMDLIIRLISSRIIHFILLLAFLLAEQLSLTLSTILCSVCNSQKCEQNVLSDVISYNESSFYMFFNITTTGKIQSRFSKDMAICTMLYHRLAYCFFSAL